MLMRVIPFIATSLEAIKRGEAHGDGGAAAIYGMIGNIPDKGLIDEFIIQFLGEVYQKK